MAVYVYGVVYGDVAEEIPGLDASSISATSEPLSTGNLTQWIEDGAAQLNTLVARSGITASATMDEDAHARIAAAVKYYAVQKALKALGVGGDQFDNARIAWEQAYEEISSKPENLGDAYADGITSNIDTISDDHGPESWSYIGAGFGSNNQW